MVRTKTIINIDNHQYNRQAYKLGTRITTAQIPHRIGYLDKNTNILFRQDNLNYDNWIQLVNKVKDKRKCSPKDAARYVNTIYQNKLKTEQENYSSLNSFIILLRDICGKWFNITPILKVV